MPRCDVAFRCNRAATELLPVRYLVALVVVPYAARQVIKDMLLTQTDSATTLADGDPTLELPRVWSPSFVNARSASVDEGAYQFVPRKRSSTKGLDFEDGRGTPGGESASAPRLFARPATPAFEDDAIQLVEVAKSSVTFRLHGQTIKLRRQEAQMLLDLLEAAL